MKFFEYDSDCFTNCANKYGEASTELLKLKGELQDSVDELVTSGGWQTEAGEAFRDSYTNEWAPILDQYVSLLNYLKECVEFANGESAYAAILEEAKKISY